MELKFNTTDADFLPQAGGCAVSAGREGLALRGLFILILVPLVLWAIWKKRRR